MSKMMVKEWIFDGTEDKKKLAVRLITAATVLLLVFAGSPFANINTNTASAQTNPYASTGMINVTTNNSASTFNITGPANYTGNGTSWSQADAPIGNYTITFDPIPGYDTPTSDTQTLVSGGTITFTGLYNLSVGTITVTTNNSAATFNVTGPANYTGSGTSWSQANAPIGTYTITFNPIPGYDTPASDTQTLVSKGTIAFTGTYNLSVGTITVTTNNSAATFNITGPATYTGNGTSWSQADAPIGIYTITYGSIPSYDTPASDTQTLVSKGTIAFTGTFNLSVGTITVTTNNSAATFNITGPANYTGSGTSWSQADAPIGTYTITYDPISGYDTPQSDTQTLVSKGTIAFSGTYNLSVGTITVTTNNSAATFTVTGPATYTGSGTSWSQANAPIGTYTITYGSVAGYSTPASDTKTIVNSGDTIAFTGTYTPLGTITVTTNNAAATFTITGPTTYRGTGTSWSQANVPAGTYTITYGSVTGYDTPSSSSQTIVNSGDTIAFTGTYTKHIYTATLGASADAYISEQNKGTNYGTVDMNVQSYYRSRNMRSLIKVDTSILPAGSNIISATLNIYAGTVPTATRTYQINKTTTSWDESNVNWYSQPSMASIATSSANTPSIAGWMNLNVTPDVQAWVNGDNNYGWEIKDFEGSTTQYTTTFHSREYSDASLRPNLVIQYTIV